MAAHADENDTHDGDYEANVKVGTGFFTGEKEPHHDGDEKGRAGDDDAHVGGIGHGQCGIFQHKVQDKAEQTGSGEGQFLPGIFQLQMVRVEEEQCQKGQHHPGKQYLYGQKIGQ